MIDILFEQWRKAVKIFDDNKFYKVVHCCTLSFLTVCLLWLDVQLLSNNEVLIFLIINCFLFIYNKPTFYLMLKNKRSNSFFPNGVAFKRYIVFELLRLNPFFPVFLVSMFFSLMYSIRCERILSLMGILVIMIDIFIIDLYMGIYKLVIISLMIITAYMVYHGSGIFILMDSLINILVIGKTLVARYKLFLSNKGASGFCYRKDKLKISNRNLLFFLRMPLEKILEILFESIIFGIAIKYVSLPIVCYLIISTFIVDMELLQEEKIGDINYYFGKQSFISVLKKSRLFNYFLSEEFLIMVNNIITILIIMGFSIYRSLINRFSLFLFLNLIFLMVVVSYRYFNATSKVLSIKCDITQSLYRLTMLYTILITLSPFIFRDILVGISWYTELYGMIFAVIMNIFIFVLDIEKLIVFKNNGVSDESI